MTSKIITISGKGVDIVERLRDGMESRGLIELFGLKFSGVTLETGVHAAEPFALMIAQEVAAVQPAPWSGDGLPPVGTRCEVYAKSGDPYWERHTGKPVNIIAHSVTTSGDPVAVYETKDSDGFNEYHGLVAGNFRPIKTPAQIAAEEREAAVLGMLCHDALGASRRGLAEALYDAGYRKIKGEDQLPHHQLLVSQMN